jgi:hypothetical protein
MYKKICNYAVIVVLLVLVLVSILFSLKISNDIWLEWETQAIQYSHYTNWIWL